MNSRAADPHSGAVKLVADIGGTNARFALLDIDGRPADPTTLRCDDYPDLATAVQAFLGNTDIDRLHVAAVAVATPVTGDQIKLTNNHWSFSIEETRLALGLDRLHVINDWTAQALSVRHLPADELEKIGGGTQTAERAIAMIGPGTGLGVSGLIPCGSHWTPLQGEGGHVPAGVNTERELAVFTLLSKRFRHVSAERLLSGPGLTNIHSAVCELDGLPATALSPAEITGSAVAQADPSSVETLNLFCGFLGSAAGNLALTLGAEGGVFLGGGIVPRLGKFLTASPFREQFEAKGRMQNYLRGIPTFVMHSPYPALVGAAQLLI